jgi:hypothetical protein
LPSHSSGRAFPVKGSTAACGAGVGERAAARIRARQLVAVYWATVTSSVPSRS